MRDTLTKSQKTDAAILSAISRFGATVKPKLHGPGDSEDQLRGPTESLVREVAATLGLTVVMHGEVRLVEINARPDYQVDVAGASIGYIEIKRPGKGVEPEQYRGHDAKQWAKLKLLPNVLYTDGDAWALYRSGELLGSIGKFNKSVLVAGARLAPRDCSFVDVLANFLHWKPQRPRTTGQLVRAVANLCRFLRAEVNDALILESHGRRTPLFSLLAQDWRDLLFPDATDESFADQFAQTVTFALLLARFEGIIFEGEDLGSIAKKLGKKHSVMGKALAILTDDPDHGLDVALDSLVSVIGAVEWNSDKDAYIQLYDDFLMEYDSALKKLTGSYYTPEPVVRSMVEFTDKILRSRLSQEMGFASRGVVAVDPAMGTGTFLAEIIKRSARTISELQGPGASGPYVRELATRRLVGFERQIGPYAVAEIRLHDALRHSDAEASEGRLRIYIADTLDDPYIEQTRLGTTYDTIARCRRAANRLKREEPVMVVIGNPPYDATQSGAGKWIESGLVAGCHPIDSFRAAGNGRYEYVLTNMHVYFWRWATWKVFDQHSDSPYGVVAFISPSAYLTSKGFAGMREYLRRTTDEGWIIDLSPEGHQPDVGTRVFPGVRQPICIGIFCRYDGPDRETPAAIHYRAISGNRQEKFDELERINLTDSEWTTCGSGWQDPLRPAQDVGWIEMPSLDELTPWTSRGVTPGRTWVYSPSRETLSLRWRYLIGTQAGERRALFLESRDRTLNSKVESLPGMRVHENTLLDESDYNVTPVRIGYRSFDRQWIIPDSRVMSVPRPDLWRVRSEKQIFMCELHTKPATNGPPVTFSALIPDLHYYRGNNGGRAIPFYRDDMGSDANILPGLLTFLASVLETRITAEEFFAYVAGMVAHPGYTCRFRSELDTPGVRVPLTADLHRWKHAISLGSEVLWLHTYGERYVDADHGRPYGAPMLPADQRPRVQVSIPDTSEAMPAEISYESDTMTLCVGMGRISPVAPEVWLYEVSGMRVIKKWFGYRKKTPSGRRSSDLDDINASVWLSEFTTELLELLNVLGRLTLLQPAQSRLLDAICAGPLVSRSDLVSARVLPVPAASRRPKLTRRGTLFDV